MSLSREQHNRIMRIYQDRRMQAAEERENRVSEVSLHAPAYAALTAELADARTDYARARLQKNIPAQEAGKSRILSLCSERREALTAGGYPADYLELRYTCPLCRDTGYAGNKRCGCMKKLISELVYREEAGLPSSLSGESFESFDLRVFDNSEPIAELSAKAGRRGITQRAYMRTVEGLLRQYAEQFSEKGGSLLLSGQTGTGKTFLCNCIAKEVIGQCRQVFYFKSESFFDQLARENFERQAEDRTFVSEEALSCDLLILDDLGTERRTDFVLSKLFSLIDTRLRSDRATILSTNLGGNNIISVYGERIASRLARYRVIPFYGKDLRLTRGA